MVKLELYFLALLLTVVTPSHVVPGAFWTDTNGNQIEAHGAGMLTHNGIHYWFGEDKTENNQRFRNVNAYKSTDLHSWTFLSHALSMDNSTEGSEIGPESVVERPKVIYNTLTDTFVMWFHLDDSSYRTAKLGIATSRTIEGPYAYYGSIAPFGADSRDMTVWKDDDDLAYVIYATRSNSDTVIARLTPDYLDIDAKVKVFADARWEAFAMFKINGLYYMITSGLTGWSTNPNHYTYTDSLANENWAEAMPIAPDSTNTYDSQSNNIISLPGNQFILTSDRWNGDRLRDSRYMWFPIEFSADNSIKISGRDAWWFDEVSGEWGESSWTTYQAEDEAHSSLAGDAVIIACPSCSDGVGVGYVGMGGNLTFTNLPASQSTLYSITIGYFNGDDGDRRAAVGVNGNFVTTITFPPTNPLRYSKEIVFQAPFNGGQDNSIQFYNDDAYAPDFDYIKVECYRGNC